MSYLNKTVYTISLDNAEGGLMDRLIEAGFGQLINKQRKHSSSLTTWLIIDYLNDKTGKNFSCNHTNNVMIVKKLRQGYIIQDFFDVIDYVSEKESENISPKALFGDKMEDYIKEMVSDTHNVS